MFNLRIAMIRAIKAIKKVDDKITVKSEATGEHWDNKDEIPMGDAFIDAFEEKTGTIRKRRDLSYCVCHDHIQIQTQYS